MNFTLLICTYKRRYALEHLLDSVKLQSLYPHEILIIDGSPDAATKEFIESASYQNVIYHQVPEEHRGLTRQRNYGIDRVDSACEVVCFLDDDTILDVDYFKCLIQTYLDFPEAIGVGGYITNEVQWKQICSEYVPKNTDFVFDGFLRNEPSRFRIRKMLQLDSNVLPGYSPLYSHGRSVGFLPPSGKIYAVEQLMGGVSSFKNNILQQYKFSNYFEGYGLYEDADFSIRVSKVGKLYVNTKAQLAHHHDAAGRPNQYGYGKMVVRNGWYVWRVKNARPQFKDRLKWHAITWLLILIRISNVFTDQKKQEAFTESLGRMVGWFSLFVNSPKIQKES